MKKMLALLGSVSLLTSVSASVVSCELLGGAVSSLTRLGKSGDLREYVKTEIISQLTSASTATSFASEIVNYATTEVTTFVVGDTNIVTYFKDAIEKFISEESDADEWIKEGSVEILGFYWSYDDESSSKSNSAYKIADGVELDFKNNNFAVEIDYIEVESELIGPDEEEWETDYIGFIGENKKVDITNFENPSSRNLTIEYDRNDTIYEVYDEIIEVFSEKNFSSFRNRNADDSGMPTNFIISEVDGNGDIVVTIDGVTSISDISNNLKAEVTISPNRTTTTGTGTSFTVTFEYDD